MGMRKLSHLNPGSAGSTEDPGFCQLNPLILAEKRRKCASTHEHGNMRGGGGGDK